MYFAPYLEKAACGIGVVLLLLLAAVEVCRIGRVRDLFKSLAFPPSLIPFPVSFCTTSPPRLRAPWVVVQEARTGEKGQVSSQPLRTSGCF